MNKVILCGNLVRDPEVRYTAGENSIAICNFQLAVQRKFSKNSEVKADFVKCVCFGKQAEFVEKYFKKGKKMLAIGRFENNNYKNKDGNTVYDYKINVEEIEFVTSKADETTQDDNFKYGLPSDAQEHIKKNDDFMSIPDSVVDGLPFN